MTINYCSGTIAVGETKTCTITNNDIPMPPIKATGGGQIPVRYTSSNGEATFRFNAKQIGATVPLQSATSTTSTTTRACTSTVQSTTSS